VTSEAGARVARLARDLKPRTQFCAELFMDWKIQPVRNRTRAPDQVDDGSGCIGFRAPDGTFWAREFLTGRGRNVKILLYIEGAGWSP